MKKIINGKKYDTETAKKLSYWTNGYCCNDFNYCSEHLYKKTTGEYFLYCEGGALSVYSEWNGRNSCGASIITPLTDDEARRWAEKNLVCDEFESIFGEVSE